MLPQSVSRPRALALTAVALVALVVAGRQLGARGGASAGAPPAAVLERAAPAAKPAVVVHVVGAVRRPGLYRVPEGSRIADVVRRAGGATPKADVSLVNLAAPAVDGVQVVVPRREPPPPAGGSLEPAAEAPAGPVHLNTATLEELDALPGVGPVTAQKIVDWREQHGAFASVDDLDAIPGIGPARLEQLRELVAP
jgi:competence protein ComEA